MRLWLALQKKVVSAAGSKKADITGPDDSAVAAKAEVVEEVKEKVLCLRMPPKSRPEPNTAFRHDDLGMQTCPRCCRLQCPPHGSLWGASHAEQQQ